MISGELDADVVTLGLPADPPHPGYLVIDLEGELFFGAVPELDRYFDTIRERIHTGGIEFVILRLKRVRDPDAVTIERLEHFLREENGRDVGGHRVAILLAGVRPDMLKVLNNIGFARWFPTDQVFPEEDEEFSATLRAVRFVRPKLDEPGKPVPEPEKERNADPLYYLV